MKDILQKAAAPYLAEFRAEAEAKYGQPVSYVELWLSDNLKDPVTAYVKYGDRHASGWGKNINEAVNHCIGHMQFEPDLALILGVEPVAKALPSGVVL